MTLTRPLTSTATLTSTPSSTLTLHLDPRATQPPGPVADRWAMLSFQRLEVYQRSIETIKPQRYDRGVDLLTRVVAMLTKMI